MRAERELGEMLNKTPKAKGAIAGGKKESSRGTYVELRDNTPTLSSLNIDKKLSSRAQKLASQPTEKFEESVEKLQEDSP